jgi:hypothetical protein
MTTQETQVFQPCSRAYSTAVYQDKWETFTANQIVDIQFAYPNVFAAYVNAAASIQKIFRE